MIQAAGNSSRHEAAVAKEKTVGSRPPSTTVGAKPPLKTVGSKPPSTTVGAKPPLQSKDSRLEARQQQSARSHRCKEKTVGSKPPSTPVGAKPLLQSKDSRPKAAILRVNLRRKAILAVTDSRREAAVFRRSNRPDHPQQYSIFFSPTPMSQLPGRATRTTQV